MKRLLACALLSSACTTAGSTWMAQPLPGDEPLEFEEPPRIEPTRTRPSAVLRTAVTPRVIGGTDAPVQYGPDAPTSDQPEPQRNVEPAGRVLGKFRNTYYDFPSEQDFKGEPLALKNSKCGTIKEVPRGFYEAVCVQGSGTLSSGSTVSFSRRDCECAEVCPRTGQRICFDSLDAAQFPWGRGATGHAITPLLTVAVDSAVIPLHTPIYVPEFDGLPREASGAGAHDGCFIAQDRGLRVTGKHIDVFTGDTALTRLWNQLVPSNKGVTVVLDSPRCARAASPAAAQSVSK